MANHNLSWVLGAHVRFGDLDFIVMAEEELAMAPAAVRPLHSADLDAIAEAVVEADLLILSSPWLKDTLKWCRSWSSQSAGTTTGPTGAPARGRPNSMAMSYRVTVTSPTGRWKVRVSGLRRSTQAERSARSTGKRTLMCRCRSTRRANRSRPAARSM